MQPCKHYLFARLHNLVKKNVLEFSPILGAVLMKKLRPIKTLIWKYEYCMSLDWTLTSFVYVIQLYCLLSVIGVVSAQRALVTAAPSISCGVPSMPVLSALRETIRRSWVHVTKEFRYMSTYIMIQWLNKKKKSPTLKWTIYCRTILYILT